MFSFNFYAWLYLLRRLFGAIYSVFFVPVPWVKTEFKFLENVLWIFQVSSKVLLTYALCAKIHETRESRSATSQGAKCQSVRFSMHETLCTVWGEERYLFQVSHFISSLTTGFTFEDLVHSYNNRTKKSWVSTGPRGRGLLVSIVLRSN